MSTRILVSYELKVDGEVDGERLHRIESSIAAMLKLGRNNFDKLVVKKDRTNDFTHGRHDEPMFQPGTLRPRQEYDHGTA